MKPFMLSSTSVKPCSAPQLMAEGVLGELGNTGMFCMHIMTSQYVIRCFMTSNKQHARCVMPVCDIVYGVLAL